MVAYFAIESVLQDVQQDRDQAPRVAHGVAVACRSSQSGPVPSKHRVLIGTAVDPLKPFIHGLVMSRRQSQVPRCGSSTPYELQEIGIELAVTADSFTGRADDDRMKGLADVSTFFR
jgi:hypothetical protein